jgi:hemerythrin-like domain-containing protein
VGISREGGPVGVMLKEHQQGRDLVARMKSELAQYLSGDENAAPRFKIDFFISLIDALLSLFRILRLAFKSYG